MTIEQFPLNWKRNAKKKIKSAELAGSDETAVAEVELRVHRLVQLRLW
jgi:hypothetical protein